MTKYESPEKFVEYVESPSFNPHDTKQLHKLIGLMVIGMRAGVINSEWLWKIYDALEKKGGWTRELPPKPTISN